MSSTYSPGKETGYHLPQVPLVRTTRPEDTTVLQEDGPTSSKHDTIDGAVQKAISHADHAIKRSPLSLDAGNRSLTRLPKEPRRFHFTSTATSSKNPSVLHSGIQKTKRKQKRDFAVFVERTHSLQDSRHRRTNGPIASKSPEKHGSGFLESTDEPSTLRKRPLASAAERKWRARTWKQPLKSTEVVDDQDRPSAKDSVNDASMKLALQLQQFALEETRAANRVLEVRKVPGPKVKPKPPKPRLAREDVEPAINRPETADDAMNWSSDEKDTEDFVFDVYIRQTEHPGEKASGDLQSTVLATSNPDKVGMLVIDDNDQEEWELYGEEDQSSDEDWNSEEEDENGSYNSTHHHRLISLADPCSGGLLWQ